MLLLEERGATYTSLAKKNCAEAGESFVTPDTDTPDRTNTESETLSAFVENWNSSIVDSLVQHPYHCP